MQTCPWGGFMIRVIVSMAILLSTTALLQAQTECSRSILKAATQSYIAAHEAGDLSKLPLASEVKYFEWIHTLSVNLTGEPIVVEPQGSGE